MVFEFQSAVYENSQVFFTLWVGEFDSFISIQHEIIEIWVAAARSQSYKFLRMEL